MAENYQIDRRRLLQGLAGMGVVIAADTSAGNVNGVPENAERGLVKTTQGFVHYWQTGDVNNPPLVLIHQSSQSSVEFEDMAPLLADSFNVVAIDLPGHGCSDLPDRELTVQEHVDAVAEVLSYLEISSAAVLGHHGGGVLVVDLAVRYPDRVGKLLLSGVGRPDNFDVEAAVAAPMSRDMPLDADGGFLDKTWAIYQKMSAPGTPLNITFKPFLESLKQRQKPYDLHYAVYRFNYLPLLAEITQPVLLLHAEHDAAGGDTKRLLTKIADASYRKVPDCGAWQYYEQPAGNADAVREFLL